MLDEEKIKLINDQSKAAIKGEAERLAYKWKEAAKQKEIEADNFIRDCYSKIYDLDEQIKIINRGDGKSSLLNKDDVVEIKLLEFKKQAILNKLNSL